MYENTDPRSGMSRKDRFGGVALVVVLSVILLGAILAVAFVGAFLISDPVAEINTPRVSAAPTAALAPTATPATTAYSSLATAAPHSGNGSSSLLTDNPIPDIVESVSAGVVGIENYQPASAGGIALELYGSGSGFILSKDGYIITNQHVVDGARELYVLLCDGSEAEATLVGSDVATDVAVLKINRNDLTPLSLGDSSALRVGDFVLAIGNPLDSYELNGTVTFGIISALERSINIDGFTNSYLQTDAAINPGNSGGPLLNMNGEVIGINTAKSITAGYDDYGNAIAAEGIGFALPINDLKSIVEQIISDGQIVRPGIGVSVYMLDEENAQNLNTIVGIYVDAVTEGGPAEQAGIQKGDVITAYNGVTIEEQEQFVNFLRGCQVGDTVLITVYRNGKYLDLSVVVGDMNKM